MIMETIAKIRAEHFIAVIAAFFISTAITVFLLDPLRPLFTSVPLSFTAAGLILNICALYALSFLYFHFTRHDAEGVAAAYGLLVLWQASLSMLVFLSAWLTSMPGEYGIYIKLAAIVSSALAALIYAGVMFVIFWYVFPVKSAKR